MPANNVFASLSEVHAYYDGAEQRIRNEMQHRFDMTTRGLSQSEINRIERQYMQELDLRLARLNEERRQHAAPFGVTEYRITYADNNAAEIRLPAGVTINEALINNRMYDSLMQSMFLGNNNNVTYNTVGESMPRPTVSEIKEKVINAIKLTDLKKLIKCGFELETQKSNGLTYTSRPINEDRYKEGVKANAVSVQTNYDFLRRLLGEQVVRQYYHEYSGNMDYLSLFRGLTPAQYEDLMRQSEVHAARRTRREDFRVEAAEMFKIPHVEAGYDGSVKGFEFRTDGPNSFEQFSKASKEVFKINHEIDEKCSFHIHLSVNGLEHNYGEQFQLLLMEGVLRQANKVPATVLQRWRVGFEDTDIGQYFRWKVSSDKYTAIHKHHEFNTWEFRCFGNVQSHKDAMKCLKIALRAMQYAYSKQANREGTELLTASNANQVAEKVANLKTWDEIKTLFPILNQTNQPLTGAA